MPVYTCASGSPRRTGRKYVKFLELKGLETLGNVPDLIGGICVRYPPFAGLFWEGYPKDSQAWIEISAWLLSFCRESF